MIFSMIGKEKKMRRSVIRMLAAITAGVATLGMAITTGATANAVAPTAKASSITINGNGQDLTNRTFEAYRVIDITDVATDENNNESYTLDISSAYKTAVRETAQSVLKTDADATDAAVVNAISKMGDASTIRTFAETLAQKIGNATPTVDSSQFVADGTNKKASNLNAGWYLVRETTKASSEDQNAGNAPLSLFMMKGGQNITIDVKSDVPASHKKIVNADYSDPRDADDFQTNEDITYRLTFTIPSAWATQYKDGFYFTMHDELSEGLDYVSGQTPVIKIADGNTEDAIANATDWNAQVYGYAPESKTGEASESSLTTANGQSTTWTTVSWNFASADDSANRKANLKLAGKTVVVYYKARMNANAKLASDGGNGNTFQVYYQHNPGDAADGYDHTVPETPYVYTYQFVIVKQDGDTKTKLKGAEFKLYSDKNAENEVKVSVSSDGKYYVVDPTTKNPATLTTGEDGKITINGLDSGTYYLKETKAPSGYKLDDTIRTVTITPSQNGGGESGREDGDGEGDNRGESGFDASTGATVVPIADTTGSTGIRDWTAAKTGGAIDYTVNDDTSHTMTIDNYKGKLPLTGGMGIVFMLAAGVLLVAGGMASIMRRRD